MTTASLFTNQGISALKAGDKAEAQRWLRLAVKRNPNDYTAWLWLSGAVEDDQDKLDCLQQVLRIVPNNAAAAAGIAKIKAGITFDSAETINELPKVPPFVDLDAVQEYLSSPATRRLPAAQTKTTSVSEIPERVVFRVRPSLLPIMLKSALVIIGLGALAWLIMMFAPDSEILMFAFSAVSMLILLTISIELIRALIFYFFERYQLTTRALTIQTGVINTNLITIPAAHIHKVIRSRNLFSKIFRTGDIIIGLSSASTYQQNIRLRSILKCPERVRQILKVTKHT